MPQIECKDLAIGYQNKEIATNINFTVEKGDYLSIVGENGSGKSTLVKTILNILKPLSGEIKLYGSSKFKIGYLPQQTNVQKDFPASAFEIVLSGCMTKKTGILFGKAEKEIAKNNMEKLSIFDLRHKSFKSLSGGQRQRVLLARALCAAEDILLLDEPASGLDPSITYELYDILYDLNKNDKMTVITVSHDLKATLKYSSKILHIGNEQLFFGTKDEYKISDIGKNFLNFGGD